MVLVVEDDPLVRMAAVDMIETLGFVALQAGEASAALAILRGDSRIDVLFTDVGLPGMRGPELAEKARELRPQVRVVFASGYGETDEVNAFVGATQLAKPYEHDQLAEVLGKEAQPPFEPAGSVAQCGARPLHRRSGGPPPPEREDFSHATPSSIPPPLGAIIYVTNR